MPIQAEPVEVNIGPQHPTTHGVFRMVATIDGERIIDAKMVVGYLHRSMEKLAEERTYTQNIPFTDRMDYLAAMTGNLGYCLAVEKLAGIEVPERAQYLRAIFAELQRIASHCMANGAFVNDCGAWQTPVMYMFREREKILDLFEMTCGARLTTNYMRIGGVAFDVPDEFLPALDKLINDDLPARFEELEQLIVGNEIILMRARDVGVVTPEVAINASLSGPDAARRRHRLGHPQGRPLLRLRPLEVRHPGRLQRRLLRPLGHPHRGDEAERCASSGRRCTTCPAGRTRSMCRSRCARPRARPTRASSRRRASSASTSSATAARRRTAGTSARPRSSTSAC